MSLLLDLRGPSDPFLGLSSEAGRHYARNALAATFIPLPAAFFGGKSALLTVAITVASVFSQMPILFFLNSSHVSFFLSWLVLFLATAFTSEIPSVSKGHWIFPLCSLPLYHVPQISLSLSYSFSSWTFFFIIIIIFFFCFKRV